MDALQNIIVFKLDDKEYAVSYLKVEKVIRSVEITSLPNTSDKIIGIINVHGQIVPVINIRKVIGFPSREIMLSDKIIIISTNESPMGFIVDEIKGLFETKDDNVVTMEKIISDSDIYLGTIKTEDSLIPIFNTDNLLSTVEKSNLLDALKEKQHSVKT